MFDSSINSKYNSKGFMNLNDLDDDVSDTEIGAILENLERLVDIFERTYKKRIPLTTAVGLNRALSEYKNIIKSIDNFKNIMYVKYTENLTTDKNNFYKNAFERIKALSTKLAFFAIEMNNVPSVVKKKLKFTHLFDLIKIGCNMFMVNIKILSPVLQMLVFITSALLLACALIKLIPAFIEFIRKLLIMLNTGGI